VAALVPRMVELGERLLGVGDPDFLEVMEIYAEYLAVNERRAEALLMADRLHAGRMAALGADDPKTVEALVILSASHAALGDFRGPSR
jgi:hypothetical protein